MIDGRAKFPGERICKFCGGHKPMDQMHRNRHGQWRCIEHKEKPRIKRDWDWGSIQDPKCGPMPI